MKAVVVEGFDRAAPQGVGGVKVAGNYAADILPNTQNKKQGYPISLYLDSKTQSYIEEFSTSNFFGIKADGKTYVTPASAAVLPSITNKSLMALAKAAGLSVEQRPVKVDELDDFTEVGLLFTEFLLYSRRPKRTFPSAPPFSLPSRVRRFYAFSLPNTLTFSLSLSLSLSFSWAACDHSAKGVRVRHSGGDHARGLGDARGQSVHRGCARRGR